MYFLRLDACYIRDGAFRLKWFLNDGGSLPQSRRKIRHFLHDSRRVPSLATRKPRDVSSGGRDYFHLKSVSGRGLKLPNSGNPRKDVVHLFRSTERSSWPIEGLHTSAKKKQTTFP